MLHILTISKSYRPYIKYRQNLSTTHHVYPHPNHTSLRNYEYTFPPLELTSPIWLHSSCPCITSPSVTVQEAHQQSNTPDHCHSLYLFPVLYSFSYLFYFFENDKSLPPTHIHYAISTMRTGTLFLLNVLAPVPKTGPST